MSESSVVKAAYQAVNHKSRGSSSLGKRAYVYATHVACAQAGGGPHGFVPVETQSY